MPIAGGTVESWLRCLHFLQGATLSPSHPGFPVALYLRLGCLFQYFKSTPAACAMYMAVKLWQRVTKGALQGLFFGAAHVALAVVYGYIC